jgi:hypothetical protein
LNILDKDEQGPEHAGEIQKLRAAETEIESLQGWRNPRVHACVSFDDGISLYDWRTLKKLGMSDVECKEQAVEAISLAMRFGDSTESVLHGLLADEKLLREIEILLDSDDAEIGAAP